MLYGAVIFAGMFLGPLVVFLGATYFGAPWWAALIIAAMFGGLGTIVINLTGTLILKAFGVDENSR